MPQAALIADAAPTYLISRTKTNDSYSVWQMDTNLPQLFVQVETSPNATFASTKKLCAIGGYMLAYDLSTLKNDPSVVTYEMFSFDGDQPDPLNAPAIQHGQWDKFKFWQYFDHYNWDPNKTDIVQLVPMTGYVMAYMPTEARGTYMMWKFDPAPNTPNAVDPIPLATGPQDAFALIGEGSELLPVGNYVLEWMSATSDYRVWNLDPQNMHPLALPYMSAGTTTKIGSTNRLFVMGLRVLDLDTSDNSYRLWDFDPKSLDPFVGPIKTGTMPAGFDVASELTATQTGVPLDLTNAGTPGTMDFMRANVEHVVVYMLESRSMDSVLGWLYESDAPHLNFVNAEAPFKANSLSNSNEADGNTYHPYVFQDGKLSEEFVLAAPSADPFHSTADCISQQFSCGYESYLKGDKADMGGFITNNLTGEAMVTFSTEQLPVLSGLATHFAVSDYWFSPMPGGTIPNRGFALSGSNYNVTVNCEGEPQYTDFAQGATRQPIWKVLQNNGITDWKIYYSVLWEKSVFTYHLFLRNQLPSVDINKDEFVQPLEAFKKDAKQGTLPKFSFLEPAWIAPTGATSYHPGASGDMVPAEETLNEIYKAIVNSPKWDKTAFIITFSKGGGLYDHVIPPDAEPAWPHDVKDGFTYNVLGPRVPTIIVSPLVKPNTVFRSDKTRPFDGTSLLSTVLEWCGIPRARWGLGDRVPLSPTFEAVFELAEPRKDYPKGFTPPYDSKFPPKNKGD